MFSGLSKELINLNLVSVMNNVRILKNDTYK